MVRVRGESPERIIETPGCVGGEDWNRPPSSSSDDSLNQTDLLCVYAKANCRRIRGR